MNILQAMGWLFSVPYTSTNGDSPALSCAVKLPRLWFSYCQSCSEKHSFFSHVVPWSQLVQIKWDEFWSYMDLGFWLVPRSHFILDFKVKSQVSFNPHNSHHMDQQHCFLIIRFIQRSFFQLFFSFKWLSLCIYANWVLTYFNITNCSSGLMVLF